MQSCEWHDPETTMNEMELVLKKIADFEALWRTSERLTQRCSEGTSLLTTSVLLPTSTIEALLTVAHEAKE